MSETDDTLLSPVQEENEGVEIDWISHLPVNLTEYAAAIAAQFRIGNEVPAALAISVASAALGRGIQVRTTFGRTTTPNLYSIGVAETGGWKGSISEPIFASLYKCAQPSIVIVEDATAESLAAKAHSVGGVVASISSDANGALTTHLGKYSKSGQPDVAVLLKGFSNEPLRQNRISRSAVDVQVCFTIGWLLQTPIVEALYRNRSLIEQGLLGRFLVYPFANPMGDIPVDEITPPIDAQQTFDNRISELASAFYGRPEPRIISASAKAREILTNYESDTLAELPGTFIAPLAKRRGEIAWRIALILHAFEHAADAAEQEISDEAAAAAVLFVMWCSLFQEQLAEKALDLADAECLDKAMALLKFNPGGVSARDLVRKSSLFADTSAALNTLRVLEQEGGVYSKKKGKSLRFFLGARGP